MDTDKAILKGVLLNIMKKKEIDDNITRFLSKRNKISNYLMVNNGDTDKTADHLIRTIEWREKNITSYFTTDNKCIYCSDTVKHNISIIGIDYDGDYIVYCNFITSGGQLEHLFHHLYCLVDYILSNTESKKYTLVLDCYNITLNYLVYITDIISGITIMKEHFPETSKNVLIININSIVTNIFESVKYLLDKRIQKKILFVDDLSTLSEIGLENIKEYIEVIDYNNIQLPFYSIVKS